MIENAFDGLDPERAQYDIPVRRYAKILGELKPAFIHHPKSKRHIQAMLESMGVDPARTHFEVPKMRSSTSDGYLTSGTAFAAAQMGAKLRLLREERLDSDLRGLA